MEGANVQRQCVGQGKEAALAFTRFPGGQGLRLNLISLRLVCGRWALPAQGCHQGLKLRRWPCCFKRSTGRRRLRWGTQQRGGIVIINTAHVVGL